MPNVPAIEIASALARVQGRGAGTNQERLAAKWLAQEASGRRREATLETFWCRPSWAVVHAWHTVLAIAGSLVIVSDPRLGGILVVIALVSVLADWLTGRSLGRRLTAERASQNVVSRPVRDGGEAPARAQRTSASTGDAGTAPVHLIITANYDAGRTGLAYRPLLGRAAATARRALAGGRLSPGWLGWLSIELVWLIAVALGRNGGASGSAIGLAQLIPTVALVLELALLLELATCPPGPAANDNGSGTAVALALTRALDAAPPRQLTVELVLSGAGDGQMLGLSRHLRGRRRELNRRTAVVLGIAPCGAGAPAIWASDGPLVPLRLHSRLRQLAQAAAGDAGIENIRAHRGRGCSPAAAARLAGLPAITLGCLDHNGRAPASHQPEDCADRLDAGAMDAIVQLGLLLVDALDADLARTRAGGGSAAGAAGTTVAAA